MLCEILEVIKPSGAKNARYEHEARPFWHLCTSEAHFNRFYAYAFVMLDEIWTTEKATYMQFPRVLQLTRARLHHAITQDQAQLPPSLQPHTPCLPAATSSGNDDAAPSCTYYSAAVVPPDSQGAMVEGSCYYYHQSKESDKGRGSSFATRREEEEAMRCIAARKQREEYDLHHRRRPSTRNSRTFSV